MNMASQRVSNYHDESDYVIVSTHWSIQSSEVWRAWWLIKTQVCSPQVWRAWWLIKAQVRSPRVRRAWWLMKARVCSLQVRRAWWLIKARVCSLQVRRAWWLIKAQVRSLKDIGLRAAHSGFDQPACPTCFAWLYFKRLTQHGALMENQSLLMGADDWSHLCDRYVDRLKACSIEQTYTRYRKYAIAHYNTIHLNTSNYSNHNCNKPSLFLWYNSQDYFRQFVLLLLIRYTCTCTSMAKATVNKVRTSCWICIPGMWIQKRCGPSEISSGHHRHHQ